MARDVIVFVWLLHIATQALLQLAILLAQLLALTLSFEQVDFAETRHCLQFGRHERHLFVHAA